MRAQQLAAKLSSTSTRTIRRLTPTTQDHFKRLQTESDKAALRPRETCQWEQYFPNIRPAVLPYYVGTDICHVPRIEKVLYLDSKLPHSKSKGKKFSKPDVNHRFLERLFNEYELDYIHRTRLLGLTESQKQNFTNFVAGRWAAKEAIIKSGPPGRKLTLQDVMIIRFSKTEADKPRGIILSTKCANEFEAIRKRNRSCQAETASPTLEAIEQKPDSQSASEDTVETCSKTRIGTYDIEGQEVRLSISHDGVYATAVAISQLDGLGTGQWEENDARAASRKAEFELDGTSRLHEVPYAYL
ncbi:hypothetical protein E2P81_ATG05148 [Venturia nashicola]|uniref:4'-phosphopantetheinyl transferase domain-containing protein n=1 Tax=Venturia nashicola TaxID=86259 RepID=A0A4Z1P7L0_9PEZI|nr:hypothetical protein E6O75_ATG05275 [Venturia nashicola]TLD32172.1 hypothetical protein E2P81_ATG05148 [Venturia nashicola]